MDTQSISATLYAPQAKVCPPAETREVIQAMGTLIRSKNYPCVPAILSFESGQYMVGIYSSFGEAKFSGQLYEDLLHFRTVQKTTDSPYLTFWAVFKDECAFSEDEFEEKLWKELSGLSSAESRSVPWDPNFSDDPEDDDFCLSLGGDAFFIVGLHSQSQRLARQFPWPAILFNLYEQFEELARLGKYESTVKTNRAREMRFQGSINPMVEKFGDVREAIQFSGKENSADWKCPFRRS